MFCEYIYTYMCMWAYVYMCEDVCIYVYICIWVCIMCLYIVIYALLSNQEEKFPCPHAYTK